MKKVIGIFSALVLLAGFAACGGSSVKYEDPNADKGSVQWGPREIKATTSLMVNSIYDFLKNEWKSPAIILVKKFQNKTSEHIDTKMVSEEIATQLIKKRIKFVDDSLTPDAIAEMQKGMTGLMDPETAIPIGKLKSPNFYLTGDIRDNVRTDRGKNLQYVVVTLKLYQLETQELVWQDQKEFLKSSAAKPISF